MTNKDGDCCPRFDPEPWDEVTHQWKEKKFIQDEVVQFMHIPLNIAQVIGRMLKRLEAAGATPRTEDFLLLAYDPSPWKSELYMTATKDVPGARNVTLSGTYFSKVFEGPYNAVPKWIREMDATLAYRGKKAKKYYFHYTTCPKCAKKYGKNYVIAFAEI